ncbi:MAG: Holliday junction resolvase RuvX [Cyanobacteria bacterium P01_A01_bin.135]
MVSALGLDIGRKRIGVAGCDRTGLIATGLMTLHRRAFAQDLAMLQQVAQERQAQVLVVGLPYKLNGELGAQARQVQRLAGRLGRSLNLPVEYMDERLTSVAAEEQLRLMGESPSQNKEAVDRIAAAIILQNWLDERRRSVAPEPLSG